MNTKIIKARLNIPEMQQEKGEWTCIPYSSPRTDQLIREFLYDTSISPSPLLATHFTVGRGKEAISYSFFYNIRTIQAAVAYSCLLAKWKKHTLLCQSTSPLYTMKSEWNELLQDCFGADQFHAVNVYKDRLFVKSNWYQNGIEIVKNCYKEGENK